MNLLNSFEIRKRFFDFFKKHGHTKVSSSSLIPAQDPTLLFTNAGMNQFKDIFLSKEKRNYTKATSIQKCMRAGGKHNDLENVGFTQRHLTFFEMMGNFSFGDYFKKEAIFFAWNFLTEFMGLDPEKLYASVYHQDQEAYEIWNKKIKLPDNRIYKLGEADNFWQMGDTGPCGPCSEIYIDRGTNFGCGSKECAPGCHCDRFLEIWNLVFMQYNRQSDGQLNPLATKGVDTGMGLERLCSIIQNTESVYETDLFIPLINKIEQVTGINYASATNKIKSSFKVLCDHIRSASFAIADGAMPSNEGRGYVLRKIIRRASLFAQKIGSYEIFLDLVPVLVQYMSPIYKELEENKDLIISTLKNEIDKFATNLTQGQNILNNYIINITDNKKEPVISAEQAFKLYDTYGFPLELTKIIAQENNFQVDIDGFEKHMQEQKLRSGKKNKECSFTDMLNQERTQFTGYQEHVTQAVITHLIFQDSMVKDVAANSKCYVITDKSPFYVECGGQVSDQGFIKVLNQEIPLLALKKFDNTIACYIHTPVDLKVGETVTLVVNSKLRVNTMKNHTATHLLQAALITILGKNVKQAGSVVEPDYLRFDFTYDQTLTPEEIRAIEDLVNSNIMKNIELIVKNKPLEEAIKEGVIAFFGEKYNPEDVRVVEVPGFSKELCGGTHVRATGDIGVFKITQVSALSSGVKRIFAVTGPRALELFQDNFDTVKSLSQEFKVPQEKVLDAIEKQKEQVKLLNSQLKNLKTKLYKYQIPDLISKVKNIDNTDLPFLYINLDDNLNNNDLKNMALELDKIKPGFYFIVNNAGNNKAIFLALLSDKLCPLIDLKELSIFLKSKNISGGSKGNIIQGGFENFDIINKNLEQDLKNWIHKKLAQ